MRALAGHVLPAMLAWYSHIRTDAKRAVTSALIRSATLGRSQILGTVSCSTQAHTRLTPWFYWWS